MACPPDTTVASAIPAPVASRPTATASVTMMEPLLAAPCDQPSQSAIELCWNTAKPDEAPVVLATTASPCPSRPSATATGEDKKNTAGSRAKGGCHPEPAM